MDSVNLKQKLSLFSEQWTPKIIADLDDNMVCLAKLEGDFVFHAHDNQDEMFLVVEGRLRMDFRDRQVWLEKGEMIVVSKGVEHKPFAPEECCVLLIENKGTAHTGGVDDPRRKDKHDRI
ncbi:cupin domain-containing protein [Kordiimonas pumila]|uniref:Cupin domain-containing protein n=1 Tax=Kordiimonas pumila TaxID=2161677 RepID=A0ABV7D2M6_9PROT|nr:cupin domain-containing protein [Kordiimonas pumila]